MDDDPHLIFTLLTIHTPDRKGLRGLLRQPLALCCLEWVALPGRGESRSSPWLVIGLVATLVYVASSLLFNQIAFRAIWPSRLLLWDSDLPMF